MSAPTFRVALDGNIELQAFFEKIDPNYRGGTWVRKGLVKCALLVQKSAQKDQMIRGGKQAPAPDRLTSRTGTGRRSIRVNRRGLPNYVEVGSDLGYMALHEEGGDVDKTSSKGTRFASYFPPRPWLKPAVGASEPKFVGVFSREWADVITKEGAKVKPRVR